MISTRLRKELADFRVDDQIDIALAVAGFDVGEAVEFFRQGAQRLGDHLQAGGLNGDLAGLGFEQGALDADNVAHIPFFEQGELVLAHQVAVCVDLDAGLPVPSWRWKKAALPNFRMDMTRPRSLPGSRSMIRWLGLKSLA
jgi:hypothetical protein